MDLRDRQRQQNNNLSTRRAARPQPKPAQRDGLGITLGGNPLRAQNVSNEPLGAGDGVFLAADSGVVQQERRKVVVVESGDRAQSATGKIKVLIQIDREDSQIEYWVGGHIKSPILIKKFATNVLPYFSRLDNVGLGKNDWIFSYQHSAAGDTTTIGVMYGATPDLNWEITSLEASYLFTTGDGFWTLSSPQLPPAGFEVQDSISTPGPALGSFGCTDFGRIGTCQSYSLFGASDTTSIVEVVGTGLPADAAALFPGASSYYRFATATRSYWDGSYAGGTEPDVNEAYFNDIGAAELCPLIYEWREYKDAIVVQESRVSIERTLTSPAYTYAANLGNLNTNAGSFSLNKSGERYIRPEARASTYVGHRISGFLTGSVEVACKLRKNSGVPGGPDRVIPAASNQDNSAAMAKSCLIPVSPTVSKTFSFSASSTSAIFGDDFAPFVETIIIPSHNVQSAYLYRKIENTGQCLVDNFGDTNRTIATSTSTYYLFDTSERMITFASGINPLQWRLKPVEDNPAKFSRIQLSSLENILTVNLTIPVNYLADNGSGNYVQQDPVPEKVFKVPFSEDIAYIVEGDYWG
jgi:hypothetical protein